MPHEAAGPPELTPHQRLDLRVVSDDGLHALRTQLQQVDPATGRLIVIWPTEQLRLFRIGPGQAVVVEFTRPGDALYRLEALVESATTEEPPRVVLRPVDAWQRVQRRDAVRNPVDIRPNQAVRILDGGESQPFSALIVDLSTGGMRMVTTTELEMFDQLEMLFETPSRGADLLLRTPVLPVSPPPARAHAPELRSPVFEPDGPGPGPTLHLILAPQT